MTEEQKQRFIEMYQMGYPYKDIAHALSIAQGRSNLIVTGQSKRSTLSSPIT